MTPDEHAQVRRNLGVTEGARLATLVARYAEVSAFLPAICSAASAQPGMHIAIKTHPSDAPELYGALASSANVTIVPETMELGRLIGAADGLVTTRESTVAIDALALGVPSLIVGSPDHLGPLVDAGIMLGSPTVDTSRPVCTRSCMMARFVSG